MENKYVKIQKRPYCRIKDKQEWPITRGHPMYCCQDWIDDYVNHPFVPVSYHPSRRYYYLTCDSRAVWIQRIGRCIVCNHEFPTELLSKWVDVLEQEYGIENPMSADNNPEEFYTEEWWRKRGL